MINLNEAELSQIQGGDDTAMDQWLQQQYINQCNYQAFYPSIQQPSFPPNFY